MDSGLKILVKKEYWQLENLLRQAISAPLPKKEGKLRKRRLLISRIKKAMSYIGISGPMPVVAPEVVVCSPYADNSRAEEWETELSTPTTRGPEVDISQEEMDALIFAEAQRKIGFAPGVNAKNNQTPRYFIPRGTTCRVTKITRIDWQEYRTKEGLSFERFERYDSESKEYEFRSKIWLIQVWRGKVKHRDDIRFSSSEG